MRLLCLELTLLLLSKVPFPSVQGMCRCLMMDCDLAVSINDGKQVCLPVDDGAVSVLTVQLLSGQRWVCRCRHLGEKAVVVAQSDIVTSHSVAYAIGM